MNRAVYRERFLADLDGRNLKPGYLMATIHNELSGSKPIVVVVKDGDTLCCACSREDAANGKCHRAWVAPLLKAAGWRVVLDGVEV
jgi:hypothetical protein